MLSQIFDPFYLVSGVVCSALVALLTHSLLFRTSPGRGAPRKAIIFVVYCFYLFFQIAVANLDVVYRALHPQMPIHPGIVKIKTNLKSDSAITALANSITLTPGTLTVDVTDDGYLYVHWINVKSTDVDEATRLIAEKFEFFIERIFE